MPSGACSVSEGVASTLNELVALARQRVRPTFNQSGESTVAEALAGAFAGCSRKPSSGFVPRRAQEMMTVADDSGMSASLGAAAVVATLTRTGCAESQRPYPANGQPNVLNAGEVDGTVTKCD